MYHFSKTALNRMERERMSGNMSRDAIDRAPFRPQDTLTKGLNRGSRNILKERGIQEQTYRPAKMKDSILASVRGGAYVPQAGTVFIENRATSPFSKGLKDGDQRHAEAILRRHEADEVLGYHHPKSLVSKNFRAAGQDLSKTEMFRMGGTNAAHADPRVILEESKHVSRASTRVRQGISAVRMQTGELGAFQDALRYGKANPMRSGDVRRARTKMLAKQISASDAPNLLNKNVLKGTGTLLKDSIGDTGHSIKKTLGKATGSAGKTGISLLRRIARAVH